MSYETYEKETVPCENYATCKQMVTGRVKRNWKKERRVLCPVCRMDRVKRYAYLRDHALEKMLGAEFTAIVEKFRKEGEPKYYAYERILGLRK